MIKINKQPKAMRWNFCSYFEQIANPPNFLRKLALKFCLRQKSLKLRHSSNWAANLFKIWQNSNASLSVAYLFFIIYQKSIEWTIHKIFPEASKYTACSLKVSGTVSSKEAEEVWYPASFLAGHRTAI